MITCAHRKQHGDIVWFNWNSHAAKFDGTPEVEFGSTGIAVSRAGAQWIQSKIREMKVYHWDVELLKVLRPGNAKACFVFPSVGHYGLHESGILGVDKVRASHWDAWYVQEGVAPKEVGDKNRQLWIWTDRKKGNKKNVELLGEVILDDEDSFPQLEWKTYFRRDPKTLDEPIASSAWVAKYGRPPPQPLSQEEMREKFDLSRMVKWHGGAGHGTRKQREWRHQVMLAKFRVFTEDVFQAMSMEYT